jgi:hypothetical protein
MAGAWCECDHEGVGDALRSCRRCLRPRPPLESPAPLAWEPIVREGRVVGMICPGCLTYREQRAIRAEQARIIRRVKRGLSP